MATSDIGAPAGVPLQTSTTTPGPDAAAHLLDRLEALVQRHRALAHDDAAPLHAELITAEVALQLAVARRTLRRAPGPRPDGRVVPRSTDATFRE